MSPPIRGAIDRLSLPWIDVLQRTDYPTRAAAIAAEIDKARPHAVGLQEISQIAIDLSALGLLVVIDIDFLSILEEALKGRGLEYVVAGAVKNIEATPVPGISLVDYDVLLVDARRVTVNAAEGHNFAANIGVVAPGVELKRGWVQANVTIGNAAYHIVTTHLESGAGDPFSGLRGLQVSELVAQLPTARPVVLMGDLNDLAGSPMYQVLEAAGLVDSWTALRHGKTGLTCCHAPDLSNEHAEFDQRIDYIFTRGFKVEDRKFRGRIWRTGYRRSERLMGPAHSIWPSDHAGLVLRMASGSRRVD
jgi:Endonuclease/Exonuclease/phosphatase family